MRPYDIAAYIWPAYTGDEPRTRMFWSEGIGEWQSVKNAVTKYPGDSWPRRPLWGYVNEADPGVMAMETATALHYGVNVFIYDWYWYDNRPFLENCLNDGFLKAPGNEKMRFYLMWANHDANNVWNINLSDDYGDVVNWTGKADRARFETVAERAITKYFTRPNYYRIDGCPVFMIYDFNNLVAGLGGREATMDALCWFRARTAAAGFPGLHLQIVAWGANNLNYSGVDASGAPSGCSFEDLGFDSMTNYQFVHFANPDRPYAEILTDVKKEYDRIDRTYRTPYFPHVSVGWDNNPRFRRFRPGVVRDNTPAQFEVALRQAKEYVDTHRLPAPLITLNSWNEWTETSYLEPDDRNGYGYLEAIRRVFGPADGTTRAR